LVTVTVKCRLELPGVDSLKEKRRILKSMMARLRNDFNIAIAEVDDNDILRRATVAVSTVSNSTGFSHEVIDKVMDRIRSNPSVILADLETETY